MPGGAAALSRAGLHKENELERVEKEQEAAWNITEAGNSTEKGRAYSN